MQAMEDVDRPFVGGGGGELPGKSTPVGGDDKGNRPALVRVTTQGLRELRNIGGSEVEMSARYLDDFCEPANAGFSKLLRRASHLVGSKRTAGNNRH
ncbi:hypothetical protein RSO01_83880 [Reyranella soli]|uniref:Uncharacterized protein n=1 Tax=Reyranella soli TaxID=1230389 RepID=A0A512NQM6_9HYPH|nr:hypothetical protein RSO01_83880 [Reyranella soli]